MASGGAGRLRFLHGALAGRHSSPIPSPLPSASSIPFPSPPPPTQVMERFLAGMRAMDDHFRTAPLQDNLPALLGLLNVRYKRMAVGVGADVLPGGRGAQNWSVGCEMSGCMAPCPAHLSTPSSLPQVWNTTFLGHSTTALLPYQQALQHFAPHIQQLSMESNGKGVAIDGTPLPYETGAPASWVAGATLRLWVGGWI